MRILATLAAVCWKDGEVQHHGNKEQSIGMVYERIGDATQDQTTGYTYFWKCTTS